MGSIFEAVSCDASGSSILTARLEAPRKPLTITLMNVSALINGVVVMEEGRGWGGRSGYSRGHAHTFACLLICLCLQVEPFLPYEYTCEGMLERVHAYIQNQVGVRTRTGPDRNKSVNLL